MEQDCMLIKYDVSIDNRALLKVGEIAVKIVNPTSSGYYFDCKSCTTAMRSMDGKLLKTSPSDVGSLELSLLYPRKIYIPANTTQKVALSTNSTGISGIGFDEYSPDSCYAEMNMNDLMCYFNFGANPYDFDLGNLKSTEPFSINVFNDLSVDSILRYVGFTGKNISGNISAFERFDYNIVSGTLSDLVFKDTQLTGSLDSLIQHIIEVNNSASFILMVNTIGSDGINRSRTGEDDYPKDAMITVTDRAITRVQNRPR